MRPVLAALVALILTAGGLPAAAQQAPAGPMMQGYGSMTSMMAGMGLFWLLVIVVLILAAAALIKYLLSGDRRSRRDS
jgi:uncharacterized membrane protein